MWLSERAILAPKNNAVDAINDKLLHMLPGESRSYKSVDTVPDPDQVVYYPVEFLNTLQPTGVPPHNQSVHQSFYSETFIRLDSATAPDSQLNKFYLTFLKPQWSKRLHPQNSDYTNRLPHRIQETPIPHSTKLRNDNKYISRTNSKGSRTQPEGSGLLTRTTLCRLLKSRQSKQPGHHVRQQTDKKRCLPRSSSLTSKFLNYFLPVK